MPQGVVSPRVGLAASWQSAVQTLVHPNGLNLKVGTIEPHDLQVPTADGRTVYIMLFGPTAMHHDSLISSRERVRRFAHWAVHPARDCLVMLLAPAGLAPFATLQRIMLDEGLAVVPLLLLQDAEELVPMVRVFVGGARERQAMLVAAAAGTARGERGAVRRAVGTLLPLCTTGTAVLAEETVMKVIEVVGSLKELAAVAGTQGGGVEGGIDEVEGGVVRADELEKLKQMAVVLRKEVGEVAAGSIFEFFGEEFCVLPEE